MRTNFIKICLIGILGFGQLCAQETLQQTVMAKINAKEEALKTFLHDAIDYIQKNSISKACNQFSKNWDWHRQDMFIIVLDSDGLCYTFGNELNVVGEDFSMHMDLSGLNFMQRLEQMKSGYFISGLENPFNNALVYIYFESLEINHKKYFIASAFYAHETDFITYGLIRKTVELFDTIGIKKTAAAINNLFGTLRRGDISLALLKNKTEVLAHGNDPVRIGQNIFNIKSAYLNILRPEYEDFLSNPNENFTVQEVGGPLGATLFIKKYKDPKTKVDYIIGSTAHPSVQEQDIINLVKKAIRYIKDNKKEDAFSEFTTDKQSQFRIGESTISVFDKDGICLASGEYPGLVGFSRADIPDTYGQYPLKDLIDQALKFGNAWITDFDRNAYKSYYAEKVELPFETFVVVSGYWPLSKPKIAEEIVKKGIQILNRFPQSEAFEKFCDGTANFLRGDMKLIVLDEQGNTLVNGYHAKAFVWTPANQRDNFHKNIISKALEKAKTGSGWIEEKLKTTTFKAFVQTFTQKNQRKLVLYAGYYE